MNKIYDVIILGAGSGELTAGIYAGKVRLDTLLVGKGRSDGQIATTGETENYPERMIDGESGPSLIERMTKQAEKFGARRASDTIVSVDIEDPIKTPVGSDGTYKARTLIIATGAFSRPVGCEGEDEFMGRGVSHCATCDASFFGDLKAFVVSGDGPAVEEAMYLTRFAREVTVIHRRDELRATKSIQECAFKDPKLFFMWDTVVEELYGDGILSGIAVKNVKIGELTRIDADEDDGLLGVFGFIGYNPRSEPFEGKLEMDHRYIKTDENMRTNVEDVYAVDDIRVKGLRQVVTVTADRAITSIQVERWLAEQKQVIHS